MDILDLDEAQGLTIDVLEAWLVSKGWERRPLPSSDSHVWQKPGVKTFKGRRVIYQINAESMHRTLTLLATWEKIPVQQLLRDINSRLRGRSPGSLMPFPSLDALNAWPHHWLLEIEPYQAGAHPCTTVSLMIVQVGMVRAIEFKRCWPCDAAGNKVRWPINEKKEML